MKKLLFVLALITCCTVFANEAKSEPTKLKSSHTKHTKSFNVVDKYSYFLTMNSGNYIIEAFENETNKQFCAEKIPSKITAIFSEYDSPNFMIKPARSLDNSLLHDCIIFMASTDAGTSIWFYNIKSDKWTKLTENQ